jgi:hypothetical protein
MTNTNRRQMVAAPAEKPQPIERRRARVLVPTAQQAQYSRLTRTERRQGERRTVR